MKDVAINNLAKVFPSTGYFVFVITISDLILQTCKYLHILVFIATKCGQSAELRDVCMHSGTHRIRFSGVQNGGCTIYKQVAIIATC